ncbi:MAG: hypothetical protein KC619_22560 [Myxococcales bacterium]|nr:hypothetical protein [Myxococcales bacterium]
MRGGLLIALTLALAGCAQVGDIIVRPTADTDCVELVAYRADLLDCAALAGPGAGLPAGESARIRACDGEAFDTTGLPSEPLTLVTYGTARDEGTTMDPCRVVAFSCDAATPGVPMIVELTPAEACPEGCMAERCMGDCCDTAMDVSDCDGDGVPNDVEIVASTRIDTDGDTRFDHCDDDSDGDGLSDADDTDVGACTDARTRPDCDGDGIGDGTMDGEECPTTASDRFGAGCDVDLDGSPARGDLDSDGDGLSDEEEHIARCSVAAPERDCDADGIPNHLDVDSDGDGAYDVYECPEGPCPDAYDPARVVCPRDQELRCGTCASAPPVCGAERCDCILPSYSCYAGSYCTPAGIDEELPVTVGDLAGAMDLLAGEPGVLNVFPLHGLAGSRLTHSVSFPSGAMQYFTTWVPADGTIVDFLRPSLACAPNADGVRECFGVFGLEVQSADDPPLCIRNTSHVLVYSDRFFSSADPWATSFLSPAQRAALPDLPRGWSILAGMGSGTWGLTESSRLAFADTQRVDCTMTEAFGFPAYSAP